MKQVPHQHAWGRAKGQTATLRFWEIWGVWWGETVPSSRNKVQTMTLKEVLNRPCTGQVAQNTCPSGAFDEAWGKEVTDSHVKVGRPGDRRLFVGQPSTSRNEDKVALDLCQKLTVCEVHGLTKLGSPWPLYLDKLTWETQLRSQI